MRDITSEVMHYLSFQRRRSLRHIQIYEFEDLQDILSHSQTKRNENYKVSIGFCFSPCKFINDDNNLFIRDYKNEIPLWYNQANEKLSLLHTQKYLPLAGFRIWSNNKSRLTFPHGKLILDEVFPDETDNFISLPQPLIPANIFPFILSS